MTTKFCKCSFCVNVADNKSLFADSPAALAEATVAASASIGAFATVNVPPASANVAAGPKTATAEPAWVTGLTTASIAADMAAADVNGTVTYAGLRALLTDVATLLSSGNTTLTAAEFSDLKTIAANLNNGMATSGYLTYATTASIGGNAANATWTGGGAAPVALGNLAIGSSAAQVNELVGKWFLGTDLPNSTVLMNGAAPFTVTYAAVSRPLFAANGPNMNDVNQGYLGDCYLLSSLAEVGEGLSLNRLGILS